MQSVFVVITQKHVIQQCKKPIDAKCNRLTGKLMSGAEKETSSSDVDDTPATGTATTNNRLCIAYAQCDNNTKIYQ